MKKILFFSILLLSATCLLTTPGCLPHRNTFSYDLPKNWFKAGSQPGKYDMGIDKGAGINGKNAATIKSNRTDITGFGTLMQNSLPDKYLGKRVRMTGYIKSKNVDGWAGLWFRVDGDRTSKSLSFDNMSNRPVSGTTDWKKYEIVLDVPAGATNLAYGALLDGKGQIWFDNINFEIVDDTVPATDKTNREPKNLNFEE
jgi:hypothetical protein